jgi:hypothetical protein
MLSQPEGCKITAIHRQYYESPRNQVRHIFDFADTDYLRFSESPVEIHVYTKESLTKDAVAMPDEGYIVTLR